jgi:hypothetical protein
VCGTQVDVSDLVEHDKYMSSGLVPPLLRTHRYHWLAPEQLTNNGLGPGCNRLLLGIEELFVLGFPKNLNRLNLTETQLKKLAGNSMSVPFLCAAQCYQLCATAWGDECAVARPARPQDTSPAGSVSFHPHTSFNRMKKLNMPGLERRKTARSP